MHINLNIALALGGALVVIGLAFLIWLLWPRRSKEESQPEAPPAEISPEVSQTHSKPVAEQFTENSLADEEDYDFLADEESLPIKLDLARAYLEMGNYGEVEETLHRVLEIGTPEQQEQARLLLEQAKLARSEDNILNHCERGITGAGRWR